MVDYALRLPDPSFYRLPTCADLAQAEAAAVILGAPIATLYDSVGDYASGAPAAGVSSSTLAAERSPQTS